jgi:hypothetical protein
MKTLLVLLIMFLSLVVNASDKDSTKTTFGRPDASEYSLRLHKNNHVGFFGNIKHDIKYRKLRRQVSYNNNHYNYNGRNVLLLKENRYRANKHYNKYLKAPVIYRVRMFIKRTI